MFGFININKPSGISSGKVISVLRRITGIKQIGHSGTLDPLASGVLPVAIGNASRLIEYTDKNKRYTVSMYFGKVSDTFDIDGKVEETGGEKVTEKQIREVIKKYEGEIIQIPPAYSAVHYNGKRLYELARKGIVPEDIPSRKITIYENKIISFDYETQSLTLDIKCSEGTYIRSIVNDAGKDLKSGAVMYKLTRTESGGMNISDSVDLNTSLTKTDIEKNIINPLSIIKLPVIDIGEQNMKNLSNGNKIKYNNEYKGTVLLTLHNKIVSVSESNGDYLLPKKVLV